MGSRRGQWVLGAVLIASAVGIALGLSIHWFPPAGSTQADKIDTLYDVLIIASVPVFVLVVSIIVFSVIFFRMRPGQELEDGPPIHGNTRLEVVWTALPAALIAGLCTYAYVVLRDIEKKPTAAQAATREMKVKVFGEQFAWTFVYPKDVAGSELTTTQLYLPIGRPVDFRLRSKDVIHDFWVPAFRLKMDAVPGIETHYRITPKRLGNYQIVCAELCGLGHAAMRNSVTVVTPARFKQWLQQQTKPAAPSGAAPAQVAAAGRKLFADNGCSGCHTLKDAGSTAQVGPDLDKFLKGKPDAFIQQSIVKPDAFIEKGYKPGIMPPNFGQTLSKDDIKTLVAYLKEVTR
ncbi:MAG: cytochrome c oxidase subunit II [Actinobacteria bacterium]|nr:MAG: cytochrome c oxidase subunit II [Actinomycetota bacterium]